MNQAAVGFKLHCSVPMHEAEATLRLATLTVESLYGPDRVQLEMHTHVDRNHRNFVIDTNTEIGRTLAIIFSGYLRREFGGDALSMIHLKAPERALAGAGV